MRRRESCQKVLQCPGNIVGGAKRHPTTLPGHGGTFQRLPRRRRGRGVVGGYRGRQLGRLVASSSVYCARVHENVKNPVNFHSTGLVGVAKAYYVSLGCFQPVRSLSRMVRRGGASHHEIESKNQKESQSRGSQTPQSVASGLFCRLDHIPHSVDEVLYHTCSWMDYS